MRQPDQNWDEFNWEEALRESDQFAARYFRLLDRFCDLPGADELIAKHMGPDFAANLPENGFANLADWDEEEVEYFLEHLPEDDMDDELEFDDTDSFFYETEPVFVSLRQSAIGWCNVYAAVLPPEARFKGLKVLFHIGRALANLAYSIDDGLYEHPAASIAFAKRALGQVNQAVGLLNEMAQEKPSLKKILNTISSHLMKANDELVDHLQKCRRETGPNGAA